MRACRFLLLLLLLSVPRPGRADVDLPAAAENGHVALPANVVTKIPLLLTDRKGIAVQNRDAASIWCGWAPETATAADGWEVPGHTSAGFDARSTGGKGPFLYCLSVAGQVSPTDTRYMGMR